MSSTLNIGHRLGPYDITAFIGRGGMGEVYRARDSRLERDVAIKVSDVQFTERFSREARAVAALNHTNVCHIYDVGPNYLVLEYVDGETLKGPRPFQEALPLLHQLIDGIEAAHEKNIIHRDLKPANIKITPEGVVKILDFGLATAAESETADNPENSPTFTMARTEVGAILGTALYMSPEQAKGKKADRRSDVWSFGVVAYELLTGRRPFAGETVVEILGAILNQEPDWSIVPPEAQRLLRWCLDKDRRRRMGSISDARWVLHERMTVIATAGASPAPPPRVSRLPLFTAAALALLAASAGFGWWKATRPQYRPLVRLSVDLGPQAVRGGRISAVLSPDGTRLAYVASAPGGLFQLWTRRLDQQEGVPLAGTLSASPLQPYFSPNGQWIGFFADGVLKKIAAQGGSPVSLGQPTDALLSASWGEDGNIYIGALTGLSRIPESGGVAQPLKPNAGVQIFPQVLPGAKAVFINTGTPIDVNSLEDLAVGVLTLPDGNVKTLLQGGYFPRYIPTSGKNGHLVYVHEGILFGVAFDPVGLTISGSPVPLVDDLGADSGVTGGGQFSVSDSGTFVYLSGRFATAANTLQWVDSSGQTRPLLSSGNYAAPRVSPDGTRLAFSASSPKGTDIWVYDFRLDTSTQVTFTGPGAREVAWAPDSRHLVFGDGSALWWIRADGSGKPQPLLDKTSNPRPFSFAADGRLAYSPASTGLPDIATLPVDLSDPEHPKPGKPEVFLNETVVEVDPAFSPDGKFIAYASNESGVEEMYVRPFPGPGGKWKISTAGGKFPVFSRATHELFFMGGDDRIWVASYTIQDGTFSAAKPRVWSTTQVRRDGVRQNFDITPDGKQAVILPAPPVEKTAGSLHATFLFNFFDDVRRRMKQ